jgi:hypothetical protein
MNKNRNILKKLIDFIYVVNYKKYSKQQIAESLRYAINNNQTVLVEVGLPSKVLDKIFKALEQGELKRMIRKAQRRDPELARQLQSLQIASDYITNYIKSEYSGTKTKEDAINMMAAMKLGSKRRAVVNARKNN